MPRGPLGCDHGKCGSRNQDEVDDVLAVVDGGVNNHGLRFGHELVILDYNRGWIQFYQKGQD